MTQESLFVENNSITGRELFTCLTKLGFHMLDIRSPENVEVHGRRHSRSAFIQF